MRSDRWQLVVCLVGLSAWPALGVHADAPLRVVLRVAGEADRALVPRLRGQLSDTNAQLSVVETPQLEAAMPEQLARAHSLASEHNADALVWCTSADAGPQHLLHILLPHTDHILTRQLTGEAHRPLNSSALETAALLVRSALLALAQDAELGLPTRQVLAAASSNAPEPNTLRAEPVSAPQPAAAPSDPPPPEAASSDAPARAAGTRARRGESVAGAELAAPALNHEAPALVPPGWGGGAAVSSVDTAPPALSTAPRAGLAPLRARLALAAQLAVDGESSGGQRGVYASAGVGFGRWAVSAFGVVSLASELPDAFFALSVARHAVGVAIEHQLPLSDAWRFGLAAHAGALLLRRTSQAKSSAVVSYPASLMAALAFGPELALSWLPGRLGLALRVGIDVLPMAPRFERAGSTSEHAHSLWSVQPRVALGWEAALP